MSEHHVHFAPAGDRPAARRWAPALAALTVAVCLALAGVLVAPAAAGTGRPTDRAVQRALDGLVGTDGFVGALAAVTGRDGRNRHYTAGVADRRTGAPVPVDGRVRIASNTKMFVATVVLQLVGEGRVELDEPVEAYLPGLLTGFGSAGDEITVRQLLQHTSGLPDYVLPLVDGNFAANYPAVRHTYREPRELVDAGLAAEPTTAAGSFGYSNTNYIVAGLLVQRVTGRPLGEEITRRIIDRVGLRHTYWPALGDQRIHGPHPRGFFESATGELIDVTEQEPSMAWAAGALVSTPGDVNRFLTALLAGRLLGPAQLRQMQTTVDAPGFDTVGGSRYGLGLATFKLSCGGFAWSHGGNAPGYTTVNGATPDGRAATVAVTQLPSTPDQVEDLEQALDTALCH
ncbi:serine hydrolase [Solwaraspora sp. WMMD1047]|uniref:serine hydrolase domain-containing protein n=1 Tax=Solwaraspora sp. WMMD1047 TaxID=3016102 RepID=UPI002417F740|nr:serine hydrolase domain-containing protein [Solwaraspora sp. WMMD1047]MDG4832783.1 serine hydrolase [Solwaraspora sp. WMMD1047]